MHTFFASASSRVASERSLALSCFDVAMVSCRVDDSCKGGGHLSDYIRLSTATLVKKNPPPLLNCEGEGIDWQRKSLKKRV